MVYCVLSGHDSESRNLIPHQHIDIDCFFADMRLFELCIPRIFGALPPPTRSIYRRGGARPSGRFTNILCLRSPGSMLHGINFRSRFPVLACFLPVFPLLKSDSGSLSYPSASRSFPWSFSNENGSFDDEKLLVMALRWRLPGLSSFCVNPLTLGVLVQDIPSRQRLSQRVYLLTAGKSWTTSTSRSSRDVGEELHQHAPYESARSL